MRLGIAADHAGFELKQAILAALRQAGFETIDYGAFTLCPDDDYPDFVIPMAVAVSHAEIDRGIAICGSGIGACIATNKVRNVRAGVIHDLFSARQGVEDDDTNVICLGAQLLDFRTAWGLVQCFLEARFSAEVRFSRRLGKIEEIDHGDSIPPISRIPGPASELSDAP